MENVITKPTIRSNDVAAMRAAQQWDNYAVTASATGWTVKNLENGKEYHVTVDGRCDCPHFVQRLEGSGEVCKHFSRADLAERMGLVQPAPIDTWRADRDRRIARDFGPEC